LNNLGTFYYSQGQYQKAESWLQQALDLSRELFGEEHSDTALILNNFAELYRSQDRYKEAESLYVQAISSLRDHLGEKHPNTQVGIHNFFCLVKAAIAAGQQSTLSDHPLTQRAIEILQPQATD
jgi:tetratricopeptide (TPR) repeat protein